MSLPEIRTIGNTTVYKDRVELITIDGTRYISKIDEKGQLGEWETKSTKTPAETKDNDVPVSKVLSTEILRKAASAVFLATEEPIAVDLSKKLTAAATEIDRLRAEIKYYKERLPSYLQNYLLKEGKNE